MAASNAAVAAARAADVVVMAIGEGRICRVRRNRGRRSSCRRLSNNSSKPSPKSASRLVVLLRNGRALALEGAVREAQAIVVSWFLGTETGSAIADVLFGDYSPSGRLPVSFPQDSGQQPYFYNRRTTGRPQGKEGPAP